MVMGYLWNFYTDFFDWVSTKLVEESQDPSKTLLDTKKIKFSKKNCGFKVLKRGLNCNSVKISAKNLNAC